MSTDREARWRAARRAVARAHHPDLGGSLEEYLAAMAQVDARFNGQGRADPITIRTRPARRLVQATRRMARTLRRRRGYHQL